MNEYIMLYSTGCPKCNVLKSKLKEKNIAFIENISVDDMKKLGIDAVPVLKVNDKLLDFKAAIEWVNCREK